MNATREKTLHREFRALLQSVFFFVLLLISMQGGTTVADEKALEKKVERNRPEEDAREEIRLGRRNFLGIGGYASTVPGIDSDRCIVDRDIVEIIPGTGDFEIYERGRDFRRRAEGYAYRYNLIIKKAFSENLPLSCMKND